ncbi:UNKNOWN [Stylonychia lemnae]|uniref:Uncharacterized protein n=1 Tax=Stylonychia lemnae TaxID=5949 RepID=A0A078A166_STYLE|nr:UNKNOWN [Stylonychia lemnae]|eukprot:CDW75991.1 UNKNOWN [Stylonychia lemnae]
MKYQRIFLLPFIILICRISQVQATKEEVAKGFDYFNQFLLGFRGTQFVPNIQDCSNYLEQTLYNFNTSMNFIGDPNYLWFDYTLNITRYISGSLADTYYLCAISLVQAGETSNARIKEFGSATDWTTAFIQNMLGNVIGFQKIYDKINLAIKDNNNREVYYQFGRIMNLLLDFHPIPDASFNQNDDKNNFMQDQLSKIFKSQTSQDWNFDEDVTDYKREDFKKLKIPMVQALNSFEMIYYSIYGFINSTIGFNDLNSTKCMDQLGIYYTNMTQTFIRELFGGKYALYVQDSTGFFRSVNPTVESCLWTTDIMIDSFEDYALTFLNPIRVLENIGYHLGLIYDRYFEIYTIFNDDYEPQAFQFVYLGNQMGKIFFNAFYPFIYPDVQIVYPEDPEN